MQREIMAGEGGRGEKHVERKQREWDDERDDHFDGNTERLM